MGNQQSFQLEDQQYPWSKDYSLVDKQPLNNTFVLHHMPSNNVYKIKLFVTPKNNAKLKQLITTKIFKPSPYLLKLQNTQTCTKRSYCSSVQEIYLMYQYLDSNLKQQILNRKFRKEGFIEGEILLVIQNISKALMYLASIGQPHRYLSATEILISQERAIILNDPWLSENSRISQNVQGEIDGQTQHFFSRLDEHYPSPQKILYQNNLTESYNQFFSSLFSLGIIILEMIYMQSMDCLYQKGLKKIHSNKVKQKIEGVSHQSIKQDLRRLLSYQPRIRQSVCIRYKKHKTDYLFFKKPRENFKNIINKANNTTINQKLQNMNKQELDKNAQILSRNERSPNQYSKFSNLNRLNYLLPYQSQHMNKHIRERSNQFNAKKNQSLINELKKLNNKSPQQFQYRNNTNFTDSLQKIKLGSVVANKNIKKAQISFFNGPNYANKTVQNSFNLHYNQNYSKLNHPSNNPIFRQNYISNFQPQSLRPKQLCQQKTISQIRTNFFQNETGGKQNKHTLLSYHIKQAKSLNQDSNHQSFVLNSCNQNNLANNNYLLNQTNKQLQQSQRNSFAIGPVSVNQVIFDAKNSFQMGSKISHRQKSNSISFDQLDTALLSKNKDNYRNDLLQKSKQSRQKHGSQGIDLNSSIRSSEDKVKNSLQTPQRYPLKGRQNSTIREVSEQDYSHSQRSGSYSHYYERQKSFPLNQNDKQMHSTSPNRNNNILISQTQRDKQNSPQIKQLLQEGRHKISFQDGSSYIGQIKNNKKNGYGVLYYPDRQIAYEGNWLDDDFNGRGRIYNAQPEKVLKSHSFSNLSQIDSLSIWQSYDGEFVKDQKCGKGRVKLSNGQIFNGNWKSDLPDGQGKYYCNEGTVINGIWKKGIYQS